MLDWGRLYGVLRVFFQCHVFAASASRDARFCVSREEKRGNDRHFIASINDASSPVETQNFASPEQKTRQWQVFHHPNKWRMFACETQDFASLLRFATHNIM
jgi:hypothetical protein